jgi:surface polysaccharide O-acyltransferase-like enzyme
VIDRGVNFLDGTQTFEVPLYVAKAKELVGTFTATAVPLFFLIAGFLLYTKEPTWRENLKKKCRTILLPYMLWGVLVLFFLFAAQSISFTKQYFANIIIRDFTLIDFIDAFIGKFTAARDYQYPLVYQFWFLRDLFVLNLFFVIIKKSIDICPGGTFVLFFVLWVGNIPIYIVDSGALFFFALGYYIIKYNISYTYIDNIKTGDMGIMYLIAIITSLFFREKVAISSYITIVIGVLFFIKVSYTLIHNRTLYNMLTWLEEYAFWIYATHGIAIAVLIKLSVKIMPMNGAWLLAHYFMVTSLCIFILLIIGILFKKIFPKLFLILSGGR